MLNARIVYIVLMLLAGLALGVAVAMRPALASGPVPPIMALLMVSLVIDLATMALVSRRGIEPVSMNARLAGFFAAAIVYLLCTMVAGVSPG